MTIYLAADHAGFALKEEVKKHLQEQCHNVVDCGATTLVPGDDYPDYILKAAELAARNPETLGFVFGGSGQGEAMAANRIKGARCGVFYGPMAPREAVDAQGNASTDPFVMVALERSHNNANLLSFGARFVSTADAIKAVDLFLATPFSGAEHHKRRLAKF